MGGPETKELVITQPPEMDAKNPVETLDSILQSKISDQETLDKAKDIFAKVQSNFSQPINDYIKKLKDADIYDIVDIEDDPVQFLVTNIDAYLSEKKMKEIVNVVEKKQEQQNQATTSQNQTVVEQNQLNTQQNKKNVEQNKKNMEQNKIAIEKNEKQEMIDARKKTQDSYDKLDKTYQVPLTEKNKKSIPQNIIDLVTEKTKGTDLEVDDYLKFYLTANQKDFNINEPTNKKFVDDYKSLNDKLGIVTETTMKKTMDADHTDKIIQSNKDLADYVNTSDNFSKIQAPKLDEEMPLNDEFKLYAKFIDDEDIKDTITKKKAFVDDFKANGEEHRDIDDQAKYDNYTTDIETTLDKVKATLSDKTQTILKQRVLGSCISGLAGYFDNTTINQENFAEDFDINVQKWFKIDKDVLSIKGKIKDNEVWFYYDLAADTDAHLQSDDFLHYDHEHDSFHLGLEWEGKNDLGIKLPTVGELSTQAQNMLTDPEHPKANLTTLLDDSDDLQNFETALKQNVSTLLKTNFGKKEIVQSRVQRDVEKNIAIETLQKTLIPQSILETQKNNALGRNDKKSVQRQLMNIWDTSTENMSSNDLRSLRTIVEKLPTRSAKTYKHLEHKRRKLFQEMTTERTTASYSDDRWKGILKFFKSFSKKDKINMDDLGKFVNEILPKDETVQENMGASWTKTTFSNDFVEQQEHEDADDILDGQLKTLA